jgi:N-acetylmuramoyl-L-alanine amidase-like protein
MPSISKHLINRDCTFINQMYPPLVFVVHRTAGHVNVQQLYDYWQSTCISSHFGISYDGYGYDPYDIWQYVNLWDGSGANCCPESGCHPFFNRSGNANTYTITVEVCTPNTGNNGLMTAKQEESLVYLIQSVCAELGIPTGNYSEYWNDYENSHSWIGDSGGIGMHRDVSPHNKQMCPGDPYYQGQMDKIIELVRGGVVPVSKMKAEVDQLQLTLHEPVILCPPPGNSVLEIGTDFGDINARVAGHIEGTDRWEIKEINQRSSRDAYYTNIGPEDWKVDKVSVEVTEYNDPNKVIPAVAVIWPR